VDTETLEEAGAAAATLVKPATVHVTVLELNATDVV